MKLAIRYYADPKIVGLPDADTELMFVRGLARAGELGREGFIPDADLGLLTRRRRMDSCVRALVDAHLWSRVPGGYQVNAWADWQSAADALAARRMAERERQRKHRRKKEQESRDIEDSSRDVTAPEGEVDLLKQRGNTPPHDPPPPPCPPRTCQRHRDTDHPPPCGPCADARRAHDTWQAAHANGTGDRFDHRLDGQQAAQLAAAERHMAELEQRRATAIDPTGNVTRLRDVRAALRPKGTA